MQEQGMRSSQGSEFIAVALVVAVVIGLAGGYFLIRMEDRGGNAAVAVAPAPAGGPATGSLSLPDGVAMGDFRSMYLQGCVAGAQQNPDARDCSTTIPSRASAIASFRGSSASSPATRSPLPMSR
ncbi:hypothetical protein D3874_16790 [Oleomonas cavernae]|uniref:Uncharacterized protein n=1 Tax=Oleomonas cavernae TaxID=2320859 RepID=A0A418WEP6_9PROT|nr:hypothetical protein D3874_16790 [Oleomonas cavernae]